jgi:hypothetical protein
MRLAGHAFEIYGGMPTALQMSAMLTVIRQLALSPGSAGTHQRTLANSLPTIELAQATMTPVAALTPDVGPLSA